MKWPLKSSSGLQQIEDIKAFVRKTGRAELDEHAEGVNVTEMIATIDPHSSRSREEVIEEIGEAAGRHSWNWSRRSSNLWPT